MGNAALPFQWKGTTRFTVKKDYEYIQENHDEEQRHEPHEAHRARGLRHHQDQSQMHQLALPQLPQVADASAVPISGLHEVTIAMIGAREQPQEDNKRVNLMIDSGAATHVCPLWFVSQFPLHQLARGTGPQLRTVTNQHIKLHGCRCVCA